MLVLLPVLVLLLPPPLMLLPLMLLLSLMLGYTRNIRIVSTASYSIPRLPRPNFRDVVIMARYPYYVDRGLSLPCFQCDSHDEESAS